MFFCFFFSDTWIGYQQGNGWRYACVCMTCDPLWYTVLHKLFHCLTMSRNNIFFSLFLDQSQCCKKMHCSDSCWKADFWSLVPPSSSFLWFPPAMSHFAFITFPSSIKWNNPKKYFTCTGHDHNPAICALAINQFSFFHLLVVYQYHIVGWQKLPLPFQSGSLKVFWQLCHLTMIHQSFWFMLPYEAVSPFNFHHLHLCCGVHSQYVWDWAVPVQLKRLKLESYLWSKWPCWFHLWTWIAVHMGASFTLIAGQQSKSNIVLHPFLVIVDDALQDHYV